MNKTDIKIFFIGGLFPKELETNILSYSIGQPQNAANALQWNIIEGIESNIRNPIKIVNSLFIGAYPFRYKKFFIKKSYFNHSNIEKHQDVNLSFWNFPIVKHIFKAHSIKKAIESEINVSQYDMVIGYSMTYSIVLGLLHAKKNNPNITTCLIVPDLPEYMNLGKKRNNLFSIFKKISNKKLYKDIQKIDSFVILTKFMAKKLAITSKPHIVMEGIASIRNISKNKNVYTDDIKRFVYSGSLGSKYGILDLVESFHKLNANNVELLVCGGGDAVDYIKSVEKKDYRIKYLGVLNPQEVKRIQKKSYILINPRNSREEYTKYSFPSKTLEYMTSGRPVLMYHLKGIPNDYDPFLIYVDERNNSLYDALMDMLSIDSEILDKLGENAKNYVINNKNGKVQTKKILDLYEYCNRK